ncbi:MAG TPA: Hpt domain-containing protein, partial [Pseudoxanthomonas sp.]|nr:Hpt domain-containing protein [Pseudoxanthomonas sp.]
MSVLREAISHATLGWVKPELDEILRQSRIALEQHAEQPDDTGSLDACVDLLHQAHGTLRMLELAAPAMVAEEMERLAQALRDGQVEHAAEASTTLMRGTVLLPDYLERLQSGHRDIPIVLLPLLNDLRAARGAAGLGEHALLGSGAGEHSEAELDHARGSLSGRNRALLDSVGSAVKEELLQVKDEMDLYLRGARQQPEQLQPQVETLSGVADTLQLLGLPAARDGVL